MAIKAIIFDLDGTLVEWRNVQDEVEVDIAEQMGKAYHLAPKKVLDLFNEARRKIERNTKKPSCFDRMRWYTEVFQKLYMVVDEANVRALVDSYWEEIANRLTLFPQAREVLENLKNTYKLAILSQSDGERKYKELRLETLDLPKYFDVIVTSDDTGVNKPDKKNFLLVCQKLNVQPEECVIIGDQPPSDLKPAHKLKMTTVYTTEGFKFDREFKYVDYIIDQIAVLPELMQQIENEKNTE